MAAGPPAVRVAPGSFARERSFLAASAALGAHPEVERFFALDRDAIVAHHCARHPAVEAVALDALLSGRCRHLAWAGSDLLLVRNPGGVREMIVLETNSCPSGQKALPLLAGGTAYGGYLRLAQALFERRAAGGTCAMVYDKNPMEALGYASTLADHLQQDVFLVASRHGDPDPAASFDGDGVLHVRDARGRRHSIDRALRYVTQRPWQRLPLAPQTELLNPLVACLAGGRNKLMAHRAYERLNADLMAGGLRIRTPETFCDVELSDVADLVGELGGRAVLKVPYGNAGQDVHILTGRADLAAFLAAPHEFGRFVAQRLVDVPGDGGPAAGIHRHIGTRPDRRARRFAFDLRMVVASGADGFRPLTAYARRAPEALDSGAGGWQRFGTNLSYRDAAGEWATDDRRRIVLGRAGFDRLGLSLDDLVDGYVQTVLSVVAVDRAAQRLSGGAAGFDHAAFHAINRDDRFLRELPDQAFAAAA